MPKSQKRNIKKTKTKPRTKSASKSKPSKTSKKSPKIRLKKGTKPKAIVLSGYGLNCEEETKFAFDSAGAKADIVHINDLIAKPDLLSEYDILAFPGGFSYGDDTGSGKAYANKFKNHLKKQLDEFLSRNTLAIGICNGFQILTGLGVLPGALAINKNGRYIDRWVDLKSVGKSPWLKGIKKISLPIAHGEGRYIGKKKNAAFVYEKGEVCKFQNLEKNPNGSMYDIAGVLGYGGRVLGMMPHPERAMFFHQNPMWQKEKEFMKRSGRSSVNISGKEGEGLLLFRNAVNYFKKK